MENPPKKVKKSKTNQFMSSEEIEESPEEE
jgi:hypothetical protein